MFTLNCSKGASCLALTILLSACGGSSSSPGTDPTPVKKMLHADNLDQGFAAYLLLRYRIYDELPQLLAFTQLHQSVAPDLQKCPLEGTVYRMPPAGIGIYEFTQCRSQNGIIYTGKTERRIAAGPAKTNWDSFENYSYQLSSDSEVQKMSGTYYYWFYTGKQLDYYTLNYTTGTQTTQYSLTSTLGSSIEISSTAISGNQHFMLKDRDDQGQAITPVLRADDGSNLSISIGTVGQASVALRNDADGKILLTKIFSKAEVNALLAAARHLKT